MPVPDNEQQAGPPALRPPSEPAPPEPSPAPGPPIDPEQVRQFQQFQQFQELMRQQGGTALLPPTRKPLWQRILRSRLVRKLAVLALVLLGLYFAYDYYFVDDNDNLPASITGGGTTKTNLVLDKNPYETVRKVYHHIAQDAPEQVCGRFTTEAAQQFANNFGATDCTAVAKQLNTRVDKTPGSKNAYAEPNFRGKMSEIPPGNTIEVSSCDLDVYAGPRLGTFTLNRIEQNQWIITEHRLETC